MFYVEKLFGHPDLVAEVENICAAKGRKQPTSFIAPIDHGCGRTTACLYVSDMFKHNAVLPFECGNDAVVEVELDGTMPQLHAAFEEIHSAAYYSAERANDNIVGIGISALAGPYKTAEVATFLRYAKELCRSAVVMFFVNAEPTHAEQELIKKLVDSLGDKVKLMSPPDYTETDYIGLIVKLLDERGISYDAMSDLLGSMRQVINDYKVAAFEDVKSLVNRLASNADYDGYTLSITDETIHTINKEVKTYA